LLPVPLHVAESTGPLRASAADLAGR
jgi:hypothetical protein